MLKKKIEELSQIHSCLKKWKIENKDKENIWIIDPIDGTTKTDKQVEKILIAEKNKGES